MRPTRLDLEGFASFRQPTTLDFDDADLFVLSGPTGSGKSSLIDAMTFALFGIVARYGDKRLVAPVISNGRNEARVRLLFRVGDVGYTAVRVVRRTANGASTKEARLERWRGDDPDDAVVLAATADELTEAVESILGLGYEHFTTTVVLPQGAFQRFLHAKSSERQGLLVKLLDLEVFGNIGKAARTRASTLDAQASLLAQQLDAAAADVTVQAITDAADRVEALAAAVATIDAARPELDEILDEGRDMARRVQDLTAQRDALAAVEAPADLEELAGRLTEATEAAEAAVAVQAEARTQRRDLDEAVDDLPSADAVVAQRSRVDRRTALREESTAAAEEVRAAAEAVTAATATVESAQEVVNRAGADLERAREANLVAALASDLQPGDPCPVCRRPLADEVVGHDEVLDHARAAVRQAETGLAEARKAAAAAADRASRGQERQRQVAAQVARLGEDLAAVDLSGVPEELAALAERVGEAAERRRVARTVEAEADKAVTSAQRDVQAARQGLESARTALDTTRDRLSALQPPSLDRDDPAASWAALLDWVAQQRPAAAERLATAEQATAAARETYGQRMAALREELGDQPVDTAGLNMAGPLRDAFVDAHATARGRHQRLVQLRDDNRKRQQELVDVRRQGAVATELGRLLARNNFEQWLLARAVNRLVAGASQHLRVLTRDAYTLRLEPDGSFGIVDHANGGEVRSARTLSGGETFLASLSLALALSDHVADFAAEGAARLESLFIDEGFGTLDPGTVDVVRTALEELGSTGRMVGVVTHVQALAEQLPVQFHVRKESQSSVVERVDT